MNPFHHVNKISVIMPVYNAELYVERSIESCFAQEEVDEVIAVDDGSTDQSIDVLRDLQQTYSGLKVITPNGILPPGISVFQPPFQLPKLYNLKMVEQQPNRNEHHGPGFARNIGMMVAKNPWIAFLDSDDVMLPNRFKKTIEVIEQYKDCDGVHECIGVEYTSTKAERIYMELGKPIITGIKQNIQPDQLLPALTHSRKFGYISLDGLTLRKSILSKSGLIFHRRYSEDATFIVRLAAVGKVYQGDPTTIVANRVFHGNNSIAGNDKIMKSEQLASLLTLLAWWKEFQPKNQRLLHYILLRLGKFEFVEECRSILRNHYPEIKKSSVQNRFISKLIIIEQYKRVQKWKQTLA